MIRPRARAPHAPRPNIRHLALVLRQLGDNREVRKVKDIRAREIDFRDLARQVRPCGWPVDVGVAM